MEKLKLYDIFRIDCISFTLVCAILSALAYIPGLVMDITHVFNLQLFCCTTAIGVLSYLTSMFPVKSPFLADLIILLDISAVIFGMGGGIFKWFPWKLKYIILTAFIIIIVYTITNGVIIRQNIKIANAINKKLKEAQK